MRVLIVSMRYLGDCVVAAALARSVKEKMPDAEVWMLTFRRNLSILEGIESLDGVIGVETKPSYLKQIRELIRLKGTFDWAIVTHGSTRATLYGGFAGKRVVMHEQKKALKNCWRRWFGTDFVKSPGSAHKLDLIAVLLEPLLGEVPSPKPVAPFAALANDLASKMKERPFVVFHLCSQYEDKNLSNACWRALGTRVIEAGYRVAFTGGGSAFEARQIAEVTKDWAQDDFVNLSGKLSFGQTGALLREERAYVGVDTATTHVAAAVGCPTVVPFGPTSAVKWGPAPQNAPRNFKDGVSVQRSGNVSVIRHPDFLGCRECRSAHAARCPKSSNQALAECLQTLPVDLLWDELRNRLMLV